MFRGKAIFIVIICVKASFMQMLPGERYEVYGLLIIWGFRFPSGYAIIQ